MTTDEMTMPLDEASHIREALLIGLAFYGEFLERANACKTAELCGHPWPEEAKPKDQVGTADVVTKFVETLRILDICSHATQRERAGEPA
jgi:hypothetical protein